MTIKFYPTCFLYGAAVGTAISWVVKGHDWYIALAFAFLAMAEVWKQTPGRNT